MTDTAVDGRVARGERNRMAVIDATLGLINEGQLRPTARAIAERAGVALRSVFHHFDDLETLLADAADVQAARHWHLLTQVDEGTTLEARIGQVVTQRAVLFERIHFTRWAAILQHHDSTVVRARLDESRAALRRHLRRALAPEIDRVDQTTRGACEAAASWETWEVLRRDQHLSVASATKAVVLLLSAAINHKE